MTDQKIALKYAKHKEASWYPRLPVRATLDTSLRLVRLAALEHLLGQGYGFMSGGYDGSVICFEQYQGDITKEHGPYDTLDLCILEMVNNT